MTLMQWSALYKVDILDLAIICRSTGISPLLFSRRPLHHNPASPERPPQPLVLRPSRQHVTVNMLDPTAGPLPLPHRTPQHLDQSTRAVYSTFLSSPQRLSDSFALFIRLSRFSSDMGRTSRLC